MGTQCKAISKSTGRPCRAKAVEGWCWRHHDEHQSALEHDALKEIARLMLTWAARLGGENEVGAILGSSAERSLLRLHPQQRRRP